MSVLSVAAFVRGMAERASRGVVLRRRLPMAHGGYYLYVSPDASLRYWRKNSLATADPTLLELCAELLRPGHHVWDIGANVGLFSVAAAHHVGPQGTILAVEADPWLAQLLRRSCEELPDGAARVEVLHAAIAERSGKASFAISSRGRAANHLASVAGSSQAGGTRQLLDVPATTLDELLGRQRLPDIVKIDVEGAEHLCLRGAHLLLREVRPVLICEVSAPNCEEVGAVLRAHGYAFFDASRRPAERSNLPQPVWNTLAVPSEAKNVGARSQKAPNSP
jgi:FkbM family methyltransferase